MSVRVPYFVMKLDGVDVDDLITSPSGNGLSYLIEEIVFDEEISKFSTAEITFRHGPELEDFHRYLVHGKFVEILFGYRGDEVQDIPQLMLCGFIQKIGIDAKNRSVKVSLCSYLSTLGQGEKSRSLSGKNIHQVVETILEDYPNISPGAILYGDITPGDDCFQDNCTDLEYLTDLAEAFGAFLYLAPTVQDNDSGAVSWQLHLFSLDYTQVEPFGRPLIFYPTIAQLLEYDLLPLEEFDPESNLMHGAIEVSITSVNPQYQTLKEVRPWIKQEYEVAGSVSVLATTEDGAMDMDWGNYYLHVGTSVVTAVTFGLAAGKIVLARGFGEFALRGAALGVTTAASQTAALASSSTAAIQAAGLTAVSVGGQITQLLCPWNPEVITSSKTVEYGGYSIVTETTGIQYIDDGEENSMSDIVFETEDIMAQTREAIWGSWLYDEETDSLIRVGGLIDTYMTTEEMASRRYGYGFEFDGTWHTFLSGGFYNDVPTFGLGTLTIKHDDITEIGSPEYGEDVTYTRVRNGTYVSFECFGEKSYVYFNYNVTDEEAQEAIAKGILDGNGLSFVAVKNAKLAEGCQFLRAGQCRNVILQDFPMFGGSFSGKYWISKTTHKMSRKNGYSTTFKANKNEIVLPPPPSVRVSEPEPTEATDDNMDVWAFDEAQRGMYDKMWNFTYRVRYPEEENCIYPFDYPSWRLATPWDDDIQRVQGRMALREQYPDLTFLGVGGLNQFVGIKIF